MYYCSYWSECYYEEPYAGKPHVRICEGLRLRGLSLLDYQRFFWTMTIINLWCLDVEWLMVLVFWEIPFKMYAWINLLEWKRAGEHVNEKDLKKHKYDVFRLLQIVTAGTKVESEGLVTESIHRYIEKISVLDELEVRLLQMGMPFDRDGGVELLKEIYL